LGIGQKDNGIKSDLMIMPIEKSENLEVQREPEIVLKFNENSILDFKQGPQSFRAKYSREKENLLLGTTEYKIIKLDSDSLIIIEKNQLLPTTFYYFKSDRNIKISKD
jgi:hypothetical protein